jgi:formylglycine-generating enzyme required for sulfatase activity
MRLALGQREDDLAALQAEHARVLDLLEARARSAANLQEEVRALAAQFEQSRSALQAQQAKTREIEEVLAERDAAIERMNQALAGRDAVIEQARGMLAERDAQIAALQAENQQHATVAASLMARAKTAETELRAARHRIDALAAVDTQPLGDTRSVGGTQSVGDTQPVGDTEPAEETIAPVVQLRRALEIGDFATPPVHPAPARAWRRIAGPLGRIGICAALAVLGIIAWAYTHHVPATAKAPDVAAPPAPGAGTVIRDCATCPSFTVLPAGRFQQGSADNTASSSVRPVHWVAIDHPIAMSTDAVTVDQFRVFVTATGRDMQGCDMSAGHRKHQSKRSWQNPGFEQGGTHPVTCTSWNDAQAYAQWLSEQTGKHYRLPSASEWEYAARAGGEAVQPWSAKGSVKASPFGLNDMLGNVSQWTEDCWNANYRGAPIDGSARKDGNCGEHELRGGSSFSSPGFVRADYRNHFAASYRSSSAGIRLVRDITP